MPSIVLTALLTFIFVLAVSAGEWKTVTSLPYAKSDHSAVAIGNQIFLVGGCSTDQICPNDLPFCICPEVTNVTEVYFPDTDGWLPASDAPHARFRHAAVAIGTKMYLLGGRDVNDVLITKVDILDTVDKTWSTSPYDWESATSDLTAVAIGSVIYAIGGYDSNYATLPTVWSFDTSSASPSWESNRIAPMIVPRGDSCTVAYENKIYVLGGYSDANFCDPSSYLEVYHFATNTWELKSSMDVDRGDFGCAIVHGKLHVIGGEHKDHVSNCSKFGFPINHVEVYDIDTNTWYEETQIPDTRFRFAATSYGDAIYLFGGQGALDSQTLTYNILDSTEQWEDTQETSFSAELSGFHFIAVSILALIL